MELYFLELANYSEQPAMTYLGGPVLGLYTLPPNAKVVFASHLAYIHQNVLF